MSATTSARELAGRLGLRRSAGGWTGPCPACGYKTGLRLSEKAGRALWWCASCQDQAAVTAAICGDAAPPSAPTAPAVPDDTGERRAAALRLWDAAMPAQGSPVLAYLAGRVPGHDADMLRDIRFLPQAKHPGGRRWPCMVSLLRDGAGTPLAVHRTFLAIGRDRVTKAEVEPAKMTLGPVRGGAVRLHQAAERLVIGEGIESSLAAAVLLRLPAWAAVSAGNLRDSLALPPSVREVTIAADHDPPGMEAAEAAARRWKAEGRAVRIAKPHSPGADFADLATERARRG